MQSPMIPGRSGKCLLAIAFAGALLCCGLGIGAVSQPVIPLEPHEGDDLESIQTAIENALPGGTVQLSSGRFVVRGRLVIVKPIALIGAGMDETEIVCADSDAVVEVSVDGSFSISDLSVRHTGLLPADVVRVSAARLEVTHCSFEGAISVTDSLPSAGLRVTGATDATVASCRITGNAGMGILVEDEASLRLMDSTCSENTMVGVALKQAAGGALERNECSANGEDGILVSGAAIVSLSDNKCSANGQAGIRLSGTATGHVRRNECLSNAVYGIYVLDQATPLLEDNRCVDNGDAGVGAGIAYFGMAAGTALRNRCSASTHGIAVAHTASPLLKENHCTENDSAGIAYYGRGAGTAYRNEC